MKIGDVVRLKSGGPKMTVSGLEGERLPGGFKGGEIEEGYASLVWFADDRIETCTIAVEALAIVPKEST